MMKKGIYSLCMLFTILFVGCDSKEMLYSADSYVMFADSALVMPVTVDAERTFDVVVGTTQAMDYDRNYVVSVDVDHSNAIEGYHFDLLNKNVRIKAGERSGIVTMKGYFDHINRTDSLAVTLKLICDKDVKLNIYGDKTNVFLYKCYPFDIDDYIGDMRMTCTFPFSSDETKNFLVKSEKIDDHTMLIKAPFDDSYDLKVKFLTTENDPMNDEITVAEQEVFTDSGYGLIYAQSVVSNPSFYIAADRGVVLYLNMFLPKVGSFGTFLYIFKWLTPYEAEAEKNGFTPPYDIRTQPVGYSLKK